ncbi:MAG: hypothetical protein ACRDZP_01130, partial [Acidimicrobiales bacterium]
VPTSANGKSQLLTAFLAGSSSYSNYGQITAYVIPREASLAPALVSQTIQSTSAISTYITQHDQHGSSVLFGPTLLVPVEDSLLYVQSLYVTGRQGSLPVLRKVIAVLGENQAGFGSDLLSALQGVFGSSVSGVGAGGPQTISAQAEQDLEAAYVAYQAAERDGRKFDLGGLEANLKLMGEDLKSAHDLTANAKKRRPSKVSSSSSRSTKSPAPTTTTAPRA